MTRNVIVVWADKGSSVFERYTPLKFAGERNRRLGYANDFDVVFLYGIDTLDLEYKGNLKALGYRLHDASKPYAAVRARYPGLERFGRFERNCFLRWLVLAECFAGERLIHYDGDVVFNEDPRVLAERISGTTFVFQGCPAWTAISNLDWLAVYKEQLDRFVADVEGYSRDAWAMRQGWEESLISKWAGSRFREIITSDQDLISHLIHTDILPQEAPEEIQSRLREYALFENPLHLHETNPGERFVYARNKGVDFLNDRRVAIWHMQSYFVVYLKKFLNRKMFLPFRKNATLGNVTRGAGSSRLRVYRQFFEKEDFSQVLNDRVWWEKGVWRP